jgi:hypothetical protein
MNSDDPFEREFASEFFQWREAKAASLPHGKRLLYINELSAKVLEIIDRGGDAVPSHD